MAARRALGAVSAAAALLLASGQCTQSADQGRGACPDGEQEETQLMQVQRRAPPPKGSSWQWAHEAFADLSLDEIGCTGTEGGEDISRKCWASAFSKLDRNSDGKISADDLHYKEDEERGNAKNLTLTDLRRGLALLATWYPEESPRLLMNEPMIISAAYKGVVPPKGTSAPEDPISGLPKKKPKATLLQDLALRGNATAVRELRGNDCVDGVAQTVVASFGIAFGILGIELPGGTLISDAITTNIKLVDGIISIVQGASSLTDATGIAGDVASILKLLYDEGVFSAVITQALDQLSWWEWAVVSAQVAGTVALWFATGLASLIIQIALVVLDAVDLVQGMMAIQQHC